MNIKDDEIPKHKSKKDTRRWCGGKAGREHDPMWEHSKRISRSSDAEWYDYTCQRCQKVLSSWWRLGLLFTSDKYERPTIGSREPLKKKVQDG